MLKVDKRYKGIILIIASAFCFALMMTFVRLAGDLPSVEKAFFRNFVAAIVAAVFVIKDKTKIKIPKGCLKFLVLRTVFGSLGIIFNFYAVDRLVLADASILNKMSPFFATVLSIFVSKEKAKPFQLGAICVAFLGAMLVIKPSFKNAELIPALSGFAGGLCAGAAYAFLRRCKDYEIKGNVIVLFFSVLSLMLFAPFMIIGFVPMSATQIFYLLLSGVCAAGGQFTITAAYLCAPAKEISVFDYTQIIFTSLIGFFLFGQVPDALSVGGYAVIIAMAVFMFIKTRKNEHKIA